MRGGILIRRGLRSVSLQERLRVGPYREVLSDRSGDQWVDQVAVRCANEKHVVTLLDGEEPTVDFDEGRVGKRCWIRRWPRCGGGRPDGAAIITSTPTLSIQSLRRSTEGEHRQPARWLSLVIAFSGSWRPLTTGSECVGPDSPIGMES